MGNEKFDLQNLDPEVLEKCGLQDVDPEVLKSISGGDFNPVPGWDFGGHQVCPKCGM